MAKTKPILNEDIFTEKGLDSNWYLQWNSVDPYAVLDGRFTALELIAIGIFMLTGKKL